MHSIVSYRIVSNWIRTFHDRLKGRSVWNDWIRYVYGAAPVRERYGNGCWQESEELLWFMGIFVIKLGTFLYFCREGRPVKKLNRRNLNRSIFPSSFLWAILKWSFMKEVKIEIWLWWINLHRDLSKNVGKKRYKIFQCLH